MKKKLSMMLSIFLSLSALSACSSNKQIEKSVDAMSKSKPMVEPVDTPTTKLYSPFTGEEVSSEVYKNIPFMAIIENSVDARPQSGLNEADVVYETMAEGGIPRFIALFQKNSPAKIGPIRSARPYFLDIAKEYNLPFAHCGYSEQAAQIIQNEKLKTLNEFIYGNSYWRDKDRKAPHNLYTSSNNLREIITSKGYNNTNPIHLNFNKTYWDNSSLPNANAVNLKLNRYYSTNYDFKDGKYYKRMDNKDAVNKEDNKQIAVTNIVVQITAIKLQNDNSHLDIALIGQGDGYIISNGKYVKGKWYKTSADSRTIFKDNSGKEIPLNPGNTWWHIIDISNTVDLK